jgi:MerR family mercuric resistance operon transcriptional regulator
MATSFTIGQLARCAGVPTTTVRYYERRGLLRPATRSGSGNYRTYGAAELERLRFIRAAQTTGFALDDVATLLAFRDGGTEPCKEVQSLIAERLADVGQRLNDLRRVERVLKASLKRCRQHEREGRCAVITTLSAPSGRVRGRARR